MDRRLVDTPVRLVSFLTPRLQGGRVADVVHEKGGYIFCQLWHTGRASPPSFRGGRQPVGPSDIPMEGKWADGTACADFPPHILTIDEIQGIAKDFGSAAKKAREVGFNGIEIHGANGYLLDQLLHYNVNDRMDQYGGSIENSTRLPLEIIEECSKAIGPDRVGRRLSPYNYFQSTKDSNPNKHWEYLCEKIATLSRNVRPLYVHMIEPRFDEVLEEQAKMEALSVYTSSSGKGVGMEPTVKIGATTL